MSNSPSQDFINFVVLVHDLRGLGPRNNIKPSLFPGQYTSWFFVWECRVSGLGRLAHC